MYVEAEHARAHNFGTDLVEVRGRVLVIDSRRARARRVAQHPLTERPCRRVGVDQSVPVLSQRLLLVPSAVLPNPSSEMFRSARTRIAAPSRWL